MKRVCLLIVFIFSIHFVGFGQTAEYYLDRGNKDYDNGNYESALWDFNSSIKLNPNNYKAYNSRGKAKYMLSDYQGAYDDYSKALELNPNSKEARSNKELANNFLLESQNDVIYSLYSKYMLRGTFNNIMDEISIINKLLEAKGDTNEQTLKLEILKAESYFSRAEVEAKNTGLMNKHGIWLKESDAQGIKYLRDLVTINPKLQNLWTGDILYANLEELINYNEKMRIYNIEKQRVTEENARRSKNNSESELSTSPKNEAKKQYLDKRYKEGKLSNQVGYGGVAVDKETGIIHSTTPMTSSAPLEIELLPEPDLPIADIGVEKLHYGEVMVTNQLESGTLQEYQNSIKIYNKSIKLNPKNTSAYLNRGIAKGNLQDYRGAIQDFNKALKLNPNLAEAYSWRALSKHSLGDLEGACLDWSKAGELGYGEAYEMIKEYCNK